MSNAHAVSGATVASGSGAGGVNVPRVPGPRLPRLRIAAFIGVLALSACGGAEGPTHDFIVVWDSAGITVTTNDLGRLSASCAVSAEPRLIIGDRPGDETHELYRVFGATVLADGRVALVNQGSQELRIYSPEGDLLTASGREGQGGAGAGGVPGRVLPMAPPRRHALGWGLPSLGVRGLCA